MNKFLFLLFIVLLCLPLVAAQDQVEVGLYVLNLGKFDIATGSFTADFYLSMKCEVECHPENFEFMNGRAASVEKIIDEPNEKFYRIQANLNSPIDLRSFPFDAQKMQIILEDKAKTTENLIYITNVEESGIDPSIVFTGWNMDGWSANVSEHNYSVYNETYSQYVFSIDISRIVLNAFLKTFLPVIFIMLVVVFSFLIDPDKVSTRLTMAGSSLVASVMFHVSISNQIPPVGYLTFADKFMMVTYMVLLFSFIINIAMLELQERKKTEVVDRLHRRTQYNVLWAVPLVYIILLLFFI
ncbi:hypothetical protein EXS74_01650 [Candidatus Woesearchaeota archaeon]|nr:hypothetical protein [Candidatus Woesearchaeota archaeon]